MNSALLTAALSALAMAGVGGRLKTVLLIVCGVVYGLCALLLIVAILLQESKGGGLAALGGTRAESAFGASNPLRKMTTVLSIVFLVLAGVLSIGLAPPRTKFKEGEGKDGDKKAPAGAPEKPADKAPVEVEVPIPAGEPGKDKEPAKDAPKDAPKEAPKETPANATAPADKPADKPAEKPAEGSAPKPAPAPAGAPAK